MIELGRTAKVVTFRVVYDTLALVSARQQHKARNGIKVKHGKSKGLYNPGFCSFISRESLHDRYCNYKIDLRR